MSRTRILVERDLEQASQLVKDYEAKLPGKPDKKTLRYDPIWRHLHASVSKFKNQLHFIDKRNKKAEVAEVKA
ncbi:MAG: hypothetical protein NTX25_19325 [Proteobacteria bacterium]|nr:hypothetical protein [Pseudomonadota bacterium]